MSQMGTPDKPFSEIADRVKSWIPWKSETANVSKDFWMPDHSCRVCYDCDLQFNVFHRRHHCRLCGRIFCAKCTAHSIPVPSDDGRSCRDEGESIRVCNFCFKQWEQEAAPADNGTRLPSPLLSPSLSTTSLASSKSNSTANSSTTGAGSTSRSAGAYQRFPYGTSASPIPTESYSDKQGLLIPGRSMDSVADVGDPSPNQYDFCMNRSDDEDDEYGACCSDSETKNFVHSNDYYGSVDFDEVDHGYRSDKVRPAEENIDCKEICSSVCDNTEFHGPSGIGKTAAEAGPDNIYGSEVPSSIYGIDCKDTESVDFENNGLLWRPPDPEDEEDDREPSLFDEDDDEDATGEWGYLRSSNRFGSGEYRCRDRSSEEHKKAMKNVVDGHFRALVAQLLQVENLPVDEEDDKESWLDIIMSLSWEAATLLKPDTSKGGGMDPGGYVKVKCIACGHRSESMVVKGVVCKKNVAHRRMQSKILKPRLLILGGALEYQRVTNLLSSFDTLLQQEMDHLKMAVAKIDVHHPNILLVEKSVSRYAQDYLLAKNISLVLNIKRPLLERISRCTGAQIVPSIDHLSSPKLGCCDFFHVEKFLEEHGSAGQGGKKMLKTLMFFDGCPKPLGCTILLMGANGDELKKVKHVVQYGIFAAYHLALETSFLADEGASLPELPLKSPITVALPDKPSSIDRSISTIPDFMIPAAGKPQPFTDVQRPNKLNAMLTSCDFEKTGVLTSPVMSSPLIDMEGFCVKKRHEGVVEPHDMVSFYSLSSPKTLSDPSLNDRKVGFVDCHESRTFGSTDQIFVDNPVTPIVGGDIFEILGKNNAVASHAPIDSREETKPLPCLADSGALNQDSKQWDEQALLKEEFPPSPSEHQSILVSLSTRCVWKGTICERAHLFRIKYYGSFDKPLGSFLRDYLFDQDYRCRSCEMPSEAHVHCYTHRQGSLTISVRKLPEHPLPGEHDGKIWMWHRCLRCPRVKGFPPATRRVVMSDAAWGLSFGKFLELSFSNHAAASRVASCGHSLHRDCLRFYGLGRMVACFRYASIHLHTVFLPPSKLDFNCHQHEWMQKEENEVADMAELLFTDVLNALRQVEERRHSSSNGSIKVPESRRHIVELERILQKEKAEFEELFQNTVKKEVKNGKSVIDILEINKLRRQLLFQSYLWDQRLILAYSPDNRPHELISSVIMINKKICSREKLVDLSQAPKLLGRFTSLDAVRQSDESPKGSSSFSGQERLLDHPNHPNLGEQRRGIDEDMFHGKQNRAFLSTSTSAGEQLEPLEYGLAMRRVLSDGQVTIMANLSDTLDAKWTGENGPTLSDASLADSAMPVEATTVGSSISYDLEEKNGSQSRASVPPTRLEDADDISNLIGLPFMNFYRCVNKNWGSSIRLDALCEYNPVYVLLFQELVRQGGARLLLPVGINSTVIPIFDEEPTSIISYALVSCDYHTQMSDERERIKDGLNSSISLPLNSFAGGHSCHSVDEISTESHKSLGSTDESIMPLSGSKSSLILDPLTYTKAMHVRVSFTDEGPLGKVKYSVTCYYSKRFDALRRTCCPSELDFVRSLSRCKKWGAQGGKSNVFFAKSLDERFIIKQVTKTELESFIKFAPEYFKYLSESIATGSPTCLAKILGIYQVTSKNLKSGKESRMDVLVMENLLFGKNVTKLYDLKGSSRSRYNSDASGNNKVLLDQNLIEAMPTSPIFVGNKAKRLLERAVWNDTSFLASIDVMDYSLLVGVDEEKHELVLGIIDFMRQYTWDKHLETWVKASGILGGSKNESPTVISPMQYKKRFRKAMSAYFLVVPDQWPPPTIIPSKSQSDLDEDKGLY